MKRLPIASLALAVVALGGVPATASGQSAGTDSVTGTASECLEFFVFPPDMIVCSRRPRLEIDAESGPAGENPSGTFVLSSEGLSPGGSPFVDGEVTCLSVSGNVGIVGVTGSRNQAGFETPIAGLLRVVDAGGADSGADTVEVAYREGDLFGPPLPGPTSCAEFPGPFPSDPFFFPKFTNETGDLVVTDAQPFPTSKEQCKQGGWRDFPGFKNQGDCVSFVSRRRP